MTLGWEHAARTGGQGRDTARTMSQKNVEIIHQAYDAMNSGDPAFLISHTHPSIELISITADFEGEAGIFRGHDGIRDYFAALPEVWSSWHWDVKEITAIGDDRVLAVVDFVAEGRDSDVPITAELAVVYVFREGLAIRAEAYHGRAAALTAVGLSE